MAPPLAARLSYDDIKAMSYEDLQGRCRDANLKTTGTAAKLRQRLGAWARQDNAKRPRSDPVDDLTCPITMDVLFDPVMAMDGRVYERQAIEKHFGGAARARSPVTNAKINTTLVPSPQMRSLVESMIENGMITGQLLENWNAKKKEKEEMDALIAEAQGGDADAMYRVGMNYHHGLSGFEENEKLGFQWVKEAQQKGNMSADYMLGNFYLHGTGVAVNKKLGLMYLGYAAGKGYRKAAMDMGDIFSKGKHGVKPCTETAIHWYGSVSNHRRARRRLQDLEREAPAYCVEALREYLQLSDESEGA